MTAAVQGSTRGYINEKIKVEGLKRKKRRMRLKAKNQNEMAIEKFVAQSSKSAKYAKTTVKKRDPSASASADPMRKADGAMSAASAAAAGITVNGQATQPPIVGSSNNNSSQAVGASASANYQTSATASVTVNGVGSAA